MRFLSRMAVLCMVISLSGCFANSLCEEYAAIPPADINNDTITDYRYQVIGDSILAYNGITCESVSHHIGLTTTQQVLGKAVSGAKVHEIETQFQPPSAPDADFDYLFVNGGLNDLIATEKVLDPEGVPCDCNGEAIDHDACEEEVGNITERMQSVISTIQSQSTTDIALVAYYPAETLDSFIGECFPYVEQLNNKYRDIAEADPKIHFIETFGAGQPVIQKLNLLGQDNYHPDRTGSGQIAAQITQQLGLGPQPTP